MNSAKFAAKLCNALPLAPPSRLGCYKGIARLFAPSLSDALRLLTTRRVFLVTSTGRTGTTWLATLLNRIDGCHVAHEPLPVEQYAHVQALQDPASARDYLVEFRLRETAWRLKNVSCSIYGEVNGALRRHAEALRALLPNVRIIHLMRNPRDVIISMLNRTAFTANDRVYSELEHPAGISRMEWLNMDRFAKLCWLWAADNAYLRTHADGRAYFEDITQDFASLSEQILQPLGLDCDESIWSEQRRLRRNPTKHRDDRHDAWSRQQQTDFDRLVMPELTHYSRYSRLPS